MIHQGDALTVLRTLPACSVQTCVTSPPYWGLRDYGTAKWKGGSKRCDHKVPFKSRGTRPLGLLHGGTATIDAGTAIRGGDCARCGARRVDEQIGLEPTPEAYVARMVEVFREVRRVLKDDGTLWLNLGDSYGGGKIGRTDADRPNGSEHANGHRNTTTSRKKPAFRPGNPEKNSGVSNRDGAGSVPGLAAKNLVGIPWRVAFALQADGWILRSDIIWHKPNPMPESVRDRPTKAHEYLFLLAKSDRYFYDADAIAEPATHAGQKMICPPNGNTQARGANVKPSGNAKPGAVHHVGSTRNARTVWTITPRPFKGAHFATFPPALVEPCVKAGSRPGDAVLDPFSGAGTTVMVAEGLGRKGVGIELNPAYIEIAKARAA